MQIEDIRLLDTLKTSENTSKLHTAGISSTNETGKSSELRNISIKDSTYKNPSAKNILDDMEDIENFSAEKTSMILSAFGMTTDDANEMEEKGFDPCDIEANTLVTIADKIKMSLAKGGKDISMMGGLSSAELSAMGSTQIFANEITKNDLPSSDAIIEDAANAFKKVDEIASEVKTNDGKLPEQSMMYLVSNDLKPTIENVFKAVYAKNTGAIAPSAEALRGDTTGLEKQFEKLVAECSNVDAVEGLDICKELLGADIPVTNQNISYLSQLKNENVNVENDQVINAMVTSVKEGNMPQEAYLYSGYSMTEKASLVYEEYQAATVESISLKNSNIDAVVAKRQLAEVQMLMSVDANYSLLRKGMQIDTMSLQELIDSLKEQEKILSSVDLVFDANDVIYEVANLPAETLGAFENIENTTMLELQQAGRDIAFKMDTAVVSDNTAEKYDAKFEAATKRYETIWTAPRKDMGDSIKKAFSNVSDILEDIGLDDTLQNQRAVRILGYNQVEITTENVEKMRAADALVQETFDNLSPAVVNKMIENGVNPLDMSIEKLNEVAKEIKNEVDDSESKFAKFLWKAEHTSGITEEQRAAFIGVYRLIHQVEATDGAAIGQLMMQNRDVTLRNLLTQVRSQKSGGKTYDIDDNFGEKVEFSREKLTITEQIELAFHEQKLHEASEEITPAKLAKFENEDEYMALSPEQLVERLLLMDDNPELIKEEIRQQTEILKEQLEMLKETASAEDKVYQFLEDNDIPANANQIQAMQEFLKNPNKMYEDLRKYAKEVPSEGIIDLDSIIEDLIVEFGEACKTPADMAEAQQRLAETAENVMKKMLVETDVRTIDVRGMKLVLTQISTLGQVAKRSENYTIPILVADETGTLNLKIVRGKEDKGIVDVAFSMENTGTVTGSFRYENGEINGELNTDDMETRQLLSDHLQMLAENMGVDMPVSLKCGFNETISATQYYEEGYGSVDENSNSEIQTATLYGIARGFIDTLAEIFS